MTVFFEIGVGKLFFIVGFRVYLFVILNQEEFMYPLANVHWIISGFSREVMEQPPESVGGLFLVLLGCIFLFAFLSWILYLQRNREKTRNRKLESQLREERRWQHNMSHHCNDGIFSFDREFRVTLWNPAMERITGVSSGSVLGIPCQQVFSFPNKITDNPHLAEALSGKESRIEREYYRIPDTAREGYFSASYFPVFGSDQEVSGGCAVLQVTDPQGFQEDPDGQSPDLSLAGQKFDEFRLLSQLNHDIRTPLNAILGMAEILPEKPASEQRDEYFQILKRSSLQLALLQESILDYAKIRRNELQLNETEFNFQEVMETILSPLGAIAQERNVELVCRIDPDVPFCLVGDFARLRQVVAGMVQFGLHHCRAGSMVLFAGRDSLHQDSETILFSLSSADLNLPRTTFTLPNKDHAGESSLLADSGQELGFLIARKLIDQMGGRMAIENQPGKGSVIQFSLPFRIAETDVTRDSGALPDLKGRRILVVDDNPVNWLVLEEILKDWGAFPTCCATGAEALAKLEESERFGDPYQIVLLDQLLQGESGFDIAEQIWQTRSRENLILVMLSSSLEPGDLERARELRISRYMMKPVRRTELARVLNQLLPRLQLSATISGNESLEK